MKKLDMLENDFLPQVYKIKYCEKVYFFILYFFPGDGRHDRHHL